MPDIASRYSRALPQLGGVFHLLIWHVILIWLLGANLALANVPRHTTNTYTRGLDLSLSLGGAGGIGGLLARTDTNGSTFYHADGNGNITGMMDGNQNMVARYEYGPFGQLLGMWGVMGPVNKIRYSSFYTATPSEIVLSPTRPYFPELQRWGSRDSIGEAGGINLYGFVRNSPLNCIDPTGLDFHRDAAHGVYVAGPVPFLRGDTILESAAAGAYDAIPEVANTAVAAGQAVMTGLSLLNQATENILGAISTEVAGDPGLGQGVNNMLAVAPFGLPEDLVKAGALVKTAEELKTAKTCVAVAAEKTATRATQLEFQFAKDVGSSDVTYLYQKVGAQGEHLKFGITDNPATRYTAAELNGGSLRIIGQGERSEMLSLERQLHETLPIGPEERQLFYIQKQAQKGLKPPPY